MVGRMLSFCAGKFSRPMSHVPEKMMVGRLVYFCEGKFSGAMLNFGGVSLNLLWGLEVGPLRGQIGD